MGVGFKGFKYGLLLTIALFAMAMAACNGGETVGRPGGADAGGSPSLGSPDASAQPELIRMDGNLSFPQREELTFGVSGSVGEILVMLGQRVSAGDKLASLDHGTVSRLKLVYSQQQVSLDRAQEDLADFRRGLQQSLAQAKDLEAQTGLASHTAEQSLNSFKFDLRLKVAQVEQAEAKAELDVVQAKEDLLDFRLDHARELAQARRERATAELALDQAVADLTNLGLDHIQELAVAIQVVADAELAANAAEDDLADFQRNYQQALAKVRHVTADAELALEQALNELADNSLSSADELAMALQAKIDAEEAVRVARQAWDDFDGSRAAQLALVNQTVTDATKVYADAKDELDKFILANILIPNPPVGVSVPLALLQAAEELAGDSLYLAKADLAAMSLITGSRRCINFRSTPMQDKCDQLTAGIKLAQAKLDKTRRDLADAQDQAESESGAHGQEPLELQQLQAKVELAKADVHAAIAVQEELEEGPDELERNRLVSLVDVTAAVLEIARKDLDDARVSINATEISRQRQAFELSRIQVEEAEAALASLGADGASVDIQEKQDALVGARTLLTTEEKTLAALESGADPLEIASVESSVRLLSEDLTDARRVVERLSGGPDPLKLAVVEAALAVAQSRLAQVKDDLLVLLEGQDQMELAIREQYVQLALENLIFARMDSQKAARKLSRELASGLGAIDLSLLEAHVSRAQSALDDAREDLYGAIIKAPFSGTVSRINVDLDDRVNDESRILEMVDSSVLEVRGSVDGTDLHRVQTGARAMVTLGSMPGRDFTGTVISVSSAPRTERGVVAFPVVVRVEMPTGVEAPLRLSPVSVEVVAGEAAQ